MMEERDDTSSEWFSMMRMGLDVGKNRTQRLGWSTQNNLDKDEKHRTRSCNLPQQTLCEKKLASREASSRQKVSSVLYHIFLLSSERKVSRDSKRAVHSNLALDAHIFGREEKS
jgi:hypothetical protein